MDLKNLTDEQTQEHLSAMVYFEKLINEWKENGQINWDEYRSAKEVISKHRNFLLTGNMNGINGEVYETEPTESITEIK